MQMQKSFIMRIFLMLLASMLLLMAISSVGIYSYSRQTVGTEYLRLNETTVNYMASTAGAMLGQIQSFAQKLAGNSRILELSSLGQDGALEIKSIMVDALGDFNASHMEGSALLEPYVLTDTGLEVSGYNSKRFTWQSVLEDQDLCRLLDGETDILILPVKTWGDNYSIMSQTFQIAVTMRDLLTDEIQGLVILDISELALHKLFLEYQNRNTFIQVVSEDGEILSARNKREIGKQLEYSLEQVSQRTVEEQTSSESIIVSAQIPGSQWHVVMRTRTEQVFGTLMSLRNVSVLLAAGCGMAAIVLVMIFARSISQRTKKIRDSMEDVVRGDLSVRLNVVRDDEFGQIEGAFNSMVEETGRLIHEIRQSERQKRIAQMDFLNAQINSHFIHNTLTSIRFMLEMDRVREAGEMIFYFSKLLRQTLSRSTEFVSLREELDTLKSYVMLQSYRYQDTFEASFDFEEEILDVSVPVLILQPVVENAIFHGASHHNSHIHICGFRDQGNLILTVQDDGQGIPREKLENIFKKDASMNRVGLRNVHERIQLIYGEKYGLSIDSRQGEGTLVRFALPMDTEGGLTNET